MTTEEAARSAFWHQSNRRPFWRRAAPGSAAPPRWGCDVKSALITGGCGFIGGRLTRRLVELGWKVIVMDDLSTGKLRSAPPNVSVHVADVAGPWPAVGDGFDAVFHLAALSRIGLCRDRPERARDVNVRGTLRAVAKAALWGAKLVFASSCTAAAPHLNDYARTKALAEDFVLLNAEHLGLNAAVARLFNVYGPGEPSAGSTATLVAKCLRAAETGKSVPVYGAGARRRDYVHVDDAVAALILLAGRKTDCLPYEVGSGATHSVADVLEMTRAAGEFAPDPYPEMSLAAADPARMRALGWAPEHNLRDYVREERTP